MICPSAHKIFSDKAKHKQEETVLAKQTFPPAYWPLDITLRMSIDYAHFVKTLKQSTPKNLPWFASEIKLEC